MHCKLPYGQVIALNTLHGTLLGGVVICQQAIAHLLWPALVSASSWALTKPRMSTRVFAASNTLSTSVASAPSTSFGTCSCACACARCSTFAKEQAAPEPMFYKGFSQSAWHHQCNPLVLLIMHVQPQAEGASGSHVRGKSA